MSKYQKLWEYIKGCDEDEVVLSFDEIKKICGVEIDHSFLSYKKELVDFGYEVVKISIKNKTVIFRKIVCTGGKLWDI